TPVAPLFLIFTTANGMQIYYNFSTFLLTCCLKLKIAQMISVCATLVFLEEKFRFWVWQAINMPQALGKLVSVKAILKALMEPGVSLWSTPEVLHSNLKIAC